MNKILNLAQVFVATKSFLGIKFFKSFSDGIDIIHGGFVINKCKENWQQEPETWDPSVWIDWMQASNEILSPKITDPAVTLVSPLQGYKIMKRYIHNFAYEFKFKDLIELFQQLDIDQNSDFQESQIWKEWLLCVDATIENRLTLDGSLFSLESTISKDQAFKITLFFIKNYCLTHIKKQITLAKILRKLEIENENSLLYQDWFLAYRELQNEQNTDKAITVIQAYNVMQRFLEKLKNNLKDQSLNPLLQLLEVDNEQIPIKYESLWNWLHATHSVLLQI